MIGLYEPQPGDEVSIANEALFVLRKTPAEVLSEGTRTIKGQACTLLLVAFCKDALKHGPLNNGSPVELSCVGRKTLWKCKARQQRDFDDRLHGKLWLKWDTQREKIAVVTLIGQKAASSKRKAEPEVIDVDCQPEKKPRISGASDAKDTATEHSSSSDTPSPPAAVIERDDKSLAYVAPQRSLNISDKPLPAPAYVYAPVTGNAMSAVPSSTMPALSGAQIQWLWINVKPTMPGHMQQVLSMLSGDHQLRLLYHWFQSQVQLQRQQQQQQQVCQQQTMMATMWR